ncbi:hypothetical protein L873DRAFT_1660216 [Choiromyces venosus 120613-1]|uniref:Uncharacterized protein n=1 Tax=Choiromyces venosus 120613-1 TaxID=1336337 RepID=A0A3N4KA52_9PEZI|nr:hypothetical protein L873DRAFT_1660216 [Choiromyces venosus 120613-1]
MMMYPIFVQLPLPGEQIPPPGATRKLIKSCFSKGWSRIQKDILPARRAKKCVGRLTSSLSEKDEKIKRKRVTCCGGKYTRLSSDLS